MRDTTERRQSLNWNVVIERGRTPWGHVLAFAFDGRVWIVFDPHVTWTEVFTLADGPEFDAWVEHYAAVGTIWRIAGRGQSHPFAGLFCVGTVKRLVGLRSGAFSPGGLRRDLIRAGATQVFVREDQDSRRRQGRPVHQGGA